jgi:hypothetical protein
MRRSFDPLLLPGTETLSQQLGVVLADNSAGGLAPDIWQGFRFPAVIVGMQFIRRFRGLVTAVSAAMLIPVFWHPHLESCDLPSHTYNAWLAELITKGQAPGLHYISQWQNVLFDYLLLTTTRLFGYPMGERIAVAVCVLSFFWGAFALVSAMTDHAGWRVVPLLAMLTYGWVFNMGFLNFYFSVGLSFFVLALTWDGGGGDFVIALVLLILISRAHVLGMVWVLFTVCFVLIARRVGLRWYPVLLMVPVVVFFAVKQYVTQHYQVRPAESDVYWLAGADQLLLFGHRYRNLAVLLVLFCVFCFAMATIRDWRNFMEKASIPMLLYTIMAVAVYWAPGGAFIPGMQAPFSYLPDRASVFTAALGCCVLGFIPLKKWQVGTLCAFALAFFIFQYGDTGQISAAEIRVEQLVEQLPPDQRVIGTLEVQGTRIAIRHIIDRACIGRCYSYANYEPSSDQFRIRAEDDNPIVTSNGFISNAMEHGDYYVQASDLPIYQVYFCGTKLTDICMAPLFPNMFNGAFRGAPLPVWR